MGCLGYRRSAARGERSGCSIWRLPHADLAEYVIPVTADTGEIDVELIDEPDLKLNGAGEGPRRARDGRSRKRDRECSVSCERSTREASAHPLRGSAFVFASL